MIWLGYECIVYHGRNVSEIENRYKKEACIATDQCLFKQDQLYIHEAVVRTLAVRAQFKNNYEASTHVHTLSFTWGG